ncbi:MULTISPECIES: AMP-binding protein [unclassified Streptomyces]|uniref:AMP-binding protein n=1 Tax=unclassified Streptomyces TaxID=2593676 RepID=UPI00345060D9
MTDAWHDLIGEHRWRSTETVWVEEGREYGRERVGTLAAAVQRAVERCEGARVVRLRADTRLGHFAGQLGVWRAGGLAVADDGSLAPDVLDRVRPDVTLSVTVGEAAADDEVEEVARAAEPLPADRLPPDVVAVNFTSGSTGRRKAVAVTRQNLLALFACRGLDVPTEGVPTAGAFAAPAFDGWWFDTWKTVAAGGRVVRLPHVNEDVFAWPELAERYGIDRVLLPAAVITTVVGAMPECLAGIPWIFSGGEQFHGATYRQARQAGLTNRFVNLYGPTEATFATHRYDLPEEFTAAAIPIGHPLEGCDQTLPAADDSPPHLRHLVVSGPLVCAGYLDGGRLAEPFPVREGHATYRTGDLVHQDASGALVYAGRLDSQIKVNGTRVDTAALQSAAGTVPGVLDCRVAQDPRGTVAFVQLGRDAPARETVRAQLEPLVRSFSDAIRLHLVHTFPTKAGGKIDFPSLMDDAHTERAGKR